MSFRYAAATPEDIPAIYTQAKCLIDMYEDLTTLDYEKVLAWVHRKISSNISQYCCVTVSGEKCAYFRLCEDGELDDLYVLPAFRGRGIGSEILRKCIAESRNPVYLYVFSRNTRAISLYERFDFSIREAVGDTRLIMVRNG